MLWLPITVDAIAVYLSFIAGFVHVCTDFVFVVITVMRILGQLIYLS